MNEPSKKLSMKQYKMLLYIIHFVHDNKFQPDFRQIAAHFEISLNAVHKRLQTLNRHKWVEIEPNKPRCISINPVVFGVADGALPFNDWVQDV